MFAVRGIAVSFSIFVILYVALSATVCCLWRRIWSYARQRPAHRSADLLFALRLTPFVFATAVTLFFAVPSFLLLEPRSGNEPVGFVAWLLGLCGVAVLAAGMGKAVSSWMRASRAIARWSTEASAADSAAMDSFPIGSRISVSVVRNSADAPPLTAAGIVRPSVWLSGAAEFVLSEKELRTALRHETVHVRRRDNLRKLILRTLAFPGMAQLENVWREASEMAADDAAVSNPEEALDLAAAVIKLSRLASLQPPAELTTALVHSPAESVNARVERLIAWPERQHDPGKKLSLVYALCAGIATAATVAVTYGEALVRVHAATEWLVR
jgi:beta-lactamase regulating signal transducer with metallopeptidase domain